MSESHQNKQRRSAAQAATNWQSGCRRMCSFITVMGLLLTFLSANGSAQVPREPNEQFIPADELDTVFDRDHRGVMMKRDEFRELLAKARANAVSRNIPIPIITEQANLVVTPGDQQAMVRLELKIRQYARDWQMLRIRAGNLLVESVEIDGQPAIIGRDSADPTALFLIHEQIGEFTAVLTMSTPLVTVGSDRTAAFELPVVPIVQLTASCPAGQHLIVNDLQLDRPAADDAVANYVIPVGNAPDVRLRWGTQRKQSEAQTLVFVRTDAQVQVQREALRWESDSRISVFGGTINRIVARVPSSLEVTSVESSGLEAWTLEDDPENIGDTQVRLTYRQPFTNDRLVRIRAVAASGSGTGDGSLQRIPTLKFSEVTAHTGRLVVTHEQGLRLVSESGSGVRRLSAADAGLSSEASVFDFWMQDFELQVAAKPRDRELFVESSAVLVLDDTTAMFNATLVVETLNAPLFELPMTVPADWELTTVELSPERGVSPPLQNVVPDGGGSVQDAVSWTTTGDPNQVLVRFAQPVSPGQLVTLVLKLTRTIADPDAEQRMLLPVVTAAETTTVGGTYRIRYADDLTVAPMSLTGLTPVAGSGTEQVFQNLGTTVSGELSIVRKPSRLASRSVLKTWVDIRQQSLDAEIVVDVLNGTIRTLTVRLSESLGPDVRFEVRGVGPVPGIEQARVIQPVAITEQSAGAPADGLRPFLLKLDHRFAGSLSLHAFVQQARTGADAPIIAPVAQVQDAVRQHGVLVFEASPDQQLSAGPEIRFMPGLFVADAGLVDAPAISTGRRIGLIYRFVQPGYAFQVNETRFATNAVPSAVCEQLANVCTLNDSGSTQRWCQAKIRSSGVQTLRFRLPEPEQSLLWSTMLNGEPVEVRRDAGDYLVALGRHRGRFSGGSGLFRVAAEAEDDKGTTSNMDSQEDVLTVLFESDSRKSGAFGKTHQGPIQFSIDAGEVRAVPIDVLQQTWRVHYPQSSLLVNSDGAFRPALGVDQPGWLASVGHFEWPETVDLPRRLVPLAIFLLVLFVLTVMVSRRRWKTLVALFVVGAVLFMLTLSTSLTGRFQSKQAREAANSFRGASLPQQELPAPNFLSDNVDFFAPADGAGMGMPAPSASPGMMGGMGGMPGGSGRVGQAAGVPGSGIARLPAGDGGWEDQVITGNSVNQSFDVPATQDLFAGQAGQATITPQDGAIQLDRLAAQADQRANLAAARFKKGVARLSVNVNLEVPADYQSRDFVSIADTVHQPSVLSIVVQRRGQIAAIRLISALIVVLLAWQMRSTVFLWKLTMAITLLLSAVALLPLLSNTWQSVLDGVVIGSLLSIVMAFVSACHSGCSCPLTWIRSTPAIWKKGSSQSTAALILLVGMMVSKTAHAGGQATPVTETIPQPDLVVPYSADEPALRANQVFIRHDDFLRLYRQAYPDALKASAVSPLGSTVVATFLKSGALTPVDGSQQVLGFDSRYVVWSDSESAVNIPLPLGPVAIRSVKVDGNEGSVQPLVVGAEGTQIPDFASQSLQQQAQAANLNAAIPTTEGPAYSVQVSGKGIHVVDVAFDITAVVEGELGRADLPLRSAVAGTLEWPLPADGLDAKVNGRTNVYRRDGRTIILPIAQLSTIRLQWLPAVRKIAGDVVFHSTVRSAMSVQDSGIVLRTTIDVNCRQGEISELEVSIPEAYSVQSVIGDDIAGWTAQSTDAARSVKLQFRRAVNDGTKVTIQLYAPAPASDALASLAVPISMVRGASRDLGTVILKTGPQFQVRSDSLSAVTQINPGDAPAPEGDSMAGRPMLAWRYTRHPALVTVKMTPTADELTADAIHALRLEEQRQLWSSRFTLLVSGAPRSRIDIAVPKGFLALDVKATGLKDWYFVDHEATDDPGVSADYRTLSIQFSDARVGKLQVALQGQMNRDVDRNLLRVQPPMLLTATKSAAELSIWLDTASESAGLENGSDWILKSAGTANIGFREIAQTAPSLAFQSSATRPGSLSIRLRQAISTLIAESVTVTNVTDTALEISLALNWQISRAAADHFAVELPAAIASLMTFDVPGQRRVTREDLGSGRMRVILQLQQPVTDRLFVLGTASLPLPTDRVIRSDVPTFMVPEGAPSTLSGQAHFWVLVNQSGGLLQPAAEQTEDKVSPEQITTQIPPQLLQQAVAVKKLHAETAVWNLVYPEQHQVAPAVVTLATHTTVIADDGSWRSRHQLQVTNESRQYLPVLLPVGSRLMYCLVQGRPSRVVIRGEGDQLRHLILIPIPQSGSLASGFEVEFALAGRFDDAASSIRKDWKSSRLAIPVPMFPEFRDDSEFGISVSRNRWSVYVPESWQATLVEDPELTNVMKATSTELEDASVLSEVEQAVQLLKSVKSAKDNFARGRALIEVQNTTERLGRNFGRDSRVEQQRGEVLGKLSEINAEYQQQAGSLPVMSGNSFLFEQDYGQNQENISYNSLFIDSNDRRGISSRSGVEQQSPPDPDAAFRFGITIQDGEDQSKEKSLDESRKQLDADKSAGKTPQSRIARPGMKSESAKTLAEGKDGIEQEQRSSRSQLLQRRSGLSESGKPLSTDESLVPQSSLSVPSEPMQQMAVPQQMINGAVTIQQSADMQRTATPTGLLSLRFDIPSDGRRVDFLRVGGNPMLSLDVRSSEAVSKGLGLIWLLICGVGILLMLGFGRKGQTIVFFQRLFLVLAVAGLMLWLLTSSQQRDIGLLTCIFAAVGFAVTFLVAQFRKQVV